MATLSRFEIHQPATLQEASKLLANYGDDASIYAGGTELLLAMRQKALNYRHLVDVKVIPGMDSIELRGDMLEIGAAATHRSIERCELVREKQPVLAELESHVANVRVRATGTLGGNLCFAEPHSDPATMLLVLEGKVRLEGASGSREVAMSEFISGAYSNSLRPGEILSKVIVPCAKPNERAAYMKFQVHERPTLGLGLCLESAGHFDRVDQVDRVNQVDQGKAQGEIFTGARVAIGCVCPFPSRVAAAEKLMTGSRAEVEKRLPLAADAIGDTADLADDHEGSIDYKRHLIHVFLRRTFFKALGEIT